MSLPALAEALAPQAAPALAATASRGPWVVGARYDTALFLLPPVLALGVGVAISGTPFTDAPVRVAGRELTGAGLLVGALVHAHLLAVVSRSHLNPGILRRHPVRFLVVPLLAWAALRASPAVAVAGTVVATFWDVWHSGLQTFGFARIYDRNAGNPPAALRRWDLWLNHLLYAGPALAGATMLDHFESLEAFGRVGLPWLATVPAQLSARHLALSLGVLAAGGVFLALYVLQAVRAARAGHAVSPQKVFLLATTGAVSLYSWGFNSWGEAFFIMNLLHAVQYLGLVWSAEGARLSGLRVLGRWRLGRAGALAAFVLPLAAYGLWAELLDPAAEGLWALTLVVSLMHFWYDGFVWSVARRDV